MARTPVNVPLTDRTKWFLDAMIESGRYGETKQDLIRTLIMDAIGRAQDAGHIKRPDKGLEGIPATEREEKS